MGHIELFNRLLKIITIIYLKRYGCVQTIYITEEYFINRIINIE